VNSCLLLGAGYALHLPLEPHAFLPGIERFGLLCRLGARVITHHPPQGLKRLTVACRPGLHEGGGLGQRRPSCLEPLLPSTPHPVGLVVGVGQRASDDDAHQKPCQRNPPEGPKASQDARRGALLPGRFRGRRLRRNPLGLGPGLLRNSSRPGGSGLVREVEPEDVSAEPDGVARPQHLPFGYPAAVEEGALLAVQVGNVPQPVDVGDLAVEAAHRRARQADDVSRGTPEHRCPGGHSHASRDGAKRVVDAL